MQDAQQKRAFGTRELVALAYSRESTRPPWRKKQRPLPGPLFDVTVVATFVILGVALLVT